MTLMTGRSLLLLCTPLLGLLAENPTWNKKGVLGSVSPGPRGAPCDAATADCGDEANLLSWKRHRRPRYGHRRPRYGSNTDDDLLGDASGLVSCYYSKTYEYPAGVNQSDLNSFA
eukprot:s11_g55.t1